MVRLAFRITNASPHRVLGCARPARGVPVGEVLWLLRWHALVLALDFAFTIAVFPSVTSAICSVHNPAQRSPCFPHAPSGRLAGNPSFQLQGYWGEYYVV